MVYAPETALMARRDGFTLIELLAVVAVILMVLILALPAISRSRLMARMTREQAMARMLMQGVMNYATEHGGEIIHGYCRHAVDWDALPVRPESTEEVARYPLRLMQYIGHYDKRLMVADSKNWYKPLMQASSYDISLFPSLGMNMLYVGGDESGNDASGLKPIETHFARVGKFCLTRISESKQPSQQIVFVSARASLGGPGEHFAGYFKVVAPNTTGVRWKGEPFTARSDAGDYGFVDLRYDDRAVVAHLDGHVEMLNEEQLRDMRRWSNQAAEQDDPDFEIRL